MERVLSPDEKLRRAEEIYYRRQGTNIRRKEKTVNVPVSNRRYLAKKMIIQIIICLLIYCTYYIVKNFNFIFSKNVIDKTDEILSYDINIQEAYCKIANYINNYEYFSNKNKDEDNKEESNNNENAQDSENIVENNELQTETKIETLAATDVNAENAKHDESSVNQMQEDVNEIKQKYSLINPLTGQITSRFGVRTATEEIISPYHVGLDIAANTGTIFVSSIDGEVVYSGELSGYGNCIQVQKDDLLIIYGHCNKLYVNKGNIVTQGQQIGEVGATGNATGAHLHFEIRKSGRYVDPSLILGI